MCKSCLLRHFAKVFQANVLLLIISAGFANAQPSAKAAGRVLDELKSRGEALIRFRLPASQVLSEMSDYLSIVSIENDSVTAFASATGFEGFIAHNYPYVLLTPPSLKTGIFVNREQGIADWRVRYPSYPEFISLMEGFAASHPQLCKLMDFGSSVKGKRLLAIKISDNPLEEEEEPAVLLTSTMHGNEPLGYLLLLRLIDYLLSSYNSDPQVTTLVNNLEIYVNPLANPDGAYYASDTSVAGSVRFNAKGADLNRDFPDPADTEWMLKNRQPETEAMMAFMEQIDLILAANFHSGEEVVNYPWDRWQTLHADDSWYWYISRKYADTVHVYGAEGYMTSFDNGITNGYAWYKAVGTRQDYTNYHLLAREVTIELSTDFFPPEYTLQDFWQFNRKSLLDYMGNALQGVTGTVLNAETGDPVIPAVIFIEDHDYDNSFVRTLRGGRYYRMLNGGDYAMLAGAQGFMPLRKEFRVKSGEQLHLDIQLQPITELQMFPNPFNGQLFLYVIEAGSDLRVEFTDISGRTALRINQPVISSGKQTIDAGSLSPGLYVVRLLLGNRSHTQLVQRLP